MGAGDWALLGLAAFAVAAVTAGFGRHVANVRLACHDPDGYTGPGFAGDVAKRIQAQATQAMPPLAPTGIIRIWRDNGELLAVEGIAWGPNAPLVVCRDPETPRFWAVIHRPTGRPFPTVYYDAEDALMAVNRLERVCDWAAPEAAIELERLMKEEVS